MRKELLLLSIFVIFLFGCASDANNTKEVQVPIEKLKDIDTGVINDNIPNQQDESNIEKPIPKEPEVALKSTFFKDDPTANEIVKGQKVADINDFGLFFDSNQVIEGDTTTFAYKIISALKQIGY